ncbi:MAG: DUF916 domain-containing protein [Vagococcus sp.]|uniref:DUF916 domain-containing protein n=1 Tax=Vagococcus sp. TaxID=1933889 RepID=UPI002FC88D60
MKNKKINFFYLFLFLSFFLLTVSSPKMVLAAEKNEFYVDTYLPDNQRVETSTYLDLLVKPDQTQELTIKVINDTSKKINYGVEVVNGITNPSMTVDYNSDPKKIDSSLKQPLTELITVEKNHSIEPRDSQNITLTLKTPKDTFEGIILGGIRVYEKSGDDESKEITQTITNYLSYIVPIKLRVDNVEELPYKTKYKETKVADMGEKIGINGTFQNPVPTITRDLTFTRTITEKGNDKVLVKDVQKNLEIAPTSSFTTSLNVEKEKLKPGDYTIIYQLENSEKKYKEKWEDTFTIKKKDIKTSQPTIINVAKKSNYLMILLVVIILLLVSYIIYINKKRGRDIK